MSTSLRLVIAVTVSFTLGCFAPTMKHIFDYYTVPGPLRCAGYLPEEMMEERQLDYQRRKNEAYKKAFGRFKDH